MKQTQTPDTTKQKELHTQGTEIQYLQNAADDLGLIIHEKYTQDKRQTIKKYFAQRGNETVSPVLDYEQLNHFLLGYRKAVNERKALLEKVGQLDEENASQTVMLEEAEGEIDLLKDERKALLDALEKLYNACKFDENNQQLTDAMHNAWGLFNNAKI